MSFTIIVATDKFGGIGLSNNNKFSIPWKNKSDIQFFKDTTSNKAVIMGKNTYLSLPVKKLPNRENIVLTKSKLDTPSDVIKCSSLDQALKYCFDKKLSTYVIGGAKLYEEALNDYRLETILWNIIPETNEKCNISS